MRADELIRCYKMEQHIENGAFVEQDYPYAGSGRAPSGMIYYYVAPGELTGFHRIDCDEYWCYHAGAPLELWMIDEAGKITVTVLGIEEGCEPIVRFPAGVTFASRHRGTPADGTFLGCITVPRFTYDGFTLFTDEEMLRSYPELKSFYED